MPRKYTISVRRFVLDLLRKHQSISQIIEFTGISRSSIWRWRRWGIEENPIVRIVPRLKNVALPLIDEFLRGKSNTTQAELVVMLSTHGLRCCAKTVFNILMHQACLIATTRLNYLRQLEDHRAGTTGNPVMMRPSDGGRARERPGTVRFHPLYGIRA